MFNNLTRLMREDSGAGPVLPPSLAELETGIGADGQPLIKPLPTGTEPPKDDKTPPKDPPKPGDPDYVEPKFGEPGYVLKPGDEGYEPKPGEEGYVPKEGEEGYVPPTEPDVNFWDEVDKITGRKLEITYPDGIEADTPAGAAHRESVIWEKAQLEFEKYLSESDPRSYAYMLHRAAGKPDSEFFGDNKGYTLPELTTLETSVEAQAAVYKYDLLSRGLDEDAAQALVDKAIKDSKLKERAITAHTAIDAAQKAQLKELQEQQTQENQQFEQNVNALTTRITNAIENELGFIVPAAKKAEFTAFVTNNLQYNDGKFFVVQELSQDKKFKTQLESLFFQFVEGNLDSVVKKQAKTQAAQGLRLRVDKAKTATPPNGDVGDKGKKYIPLGDL